MVPISEDARLDLVVGFVVGEVAVDLPERRDVDLDMVEADLVDFDRRTSLAGSACGVDLTLADLARDVFGVDVEVVPDGGRDDESSGCLV